MPTRPQKPAHPAPAQDCLYEHFVPKTWRTESLRSDIGVRHSAHRSTTITSRRTSNPNAGLLLCSSSGYFHPLQKNASPNRTVRSTLKSHFDANLRGLVFFPLSSPGIYTVLNQRCRFRLKRRRRALKNGLSVPNLRKKFIHCGL